MEESALAVMGVNHDHRYVASTIERKIRAFFGAPVIVIEDVWTRIQPLDRRGAQRKHLLWALVFLKVYSTEDVHCRIVGTKDIGTFRSWSWYMLQKVAGLKDEVINLQNRFAGWDGKTQCLMSVDGTDCPVNEPWPFDGVWFSEKFNGPAIKYEVGVCIKTGFIVWINGPFEASKNDGTIFRNTLSTLLADDEGVEVDAGYKGDDKMKAPTTATSRKQKSQVRGRHENVNGVLKVYNVLNFPFHHSNPRNEMMNKHGICFKAIAVVTQLKFEHCGVMYEVEYDVSYKG